MEDCRINVLTNRKAARFSEDVVALYPAGTGVIITDKRGMPFVLTAYHLYKPEPPKVYHHMVTFFFQHAPAMVPGKKPKKEPVTLDTFRCRAADPRLDYAIYDLEGLVPVAGIRASMDDGKYRTPVYLIGHANGKEQTLCIGDQVTDWSHSKQLWEGSLNRGMLEVGFSGAPLFDDHGRLIGILKTFISMEPCGPATVFGPKIGAICKHAAERFGLDFQP